MAKSFRDLSEQEILALAIFLEEEDARIYGEFAQRLRRSYPATAEILDRMREEESEHRANLLALFQSRFGDHVPLVRRTDVKGFVTRPATWLASSIGPKAVRRATEEMESDTRRFYLMAIDQVNDASTRKLLGDLAEAELEHTAAAKEFEKQALTEAAQAAEADTQRKEFVLQFVQPALAGLMDGSVSTLAPLFAAAFATHQSRDAFRVGLAASVGAGISMAFAEALSDDGSITGRGKPVVRGIVTGLMTAIGGLGHTLPYLIPDVNLATKFAGAVVVVELAVISWVRQYYMETPLFRAAVQVMLGGALVFVAGILIGQS
jgi:rubrerythrin